MVDKKIPKGWTREGYIRAIKITIHRYNQELIKCKEKLKKWKKVLKEIENGR